MRSQHGERFAGKGQVRTLALGCKVAGCGCEKYSEKEAGTKENGDIMPQSERVRRVARAKRKLLQGRAMIDDALRELEELEAA